jgi:hypothetical protein
VFGIGHIAVVAHIVNAVHDAGPATHSGSTVSMETAEGDKQHGAEDGDEDDEEEREEEEEEEEEGGEDEEGEEGDGDEEDSEEKGEDSDDSDGEEDQDNGDGSNNDQSYGDVRESVDGDQLRTLPKSGKLCCVVEEG